MQATRTSTGLPPVVSREEWETARQALLIREKAHTRAGDALAAERRRMPMVETTSDYIFQGEHGPARFVDLFAGKRQLILQHFMFHPDWDEGCTGCSFEVDHIPNLAHLHARDTHYVIVSRAPIEKLMAYRDRMGWDVNWYSSYGTSFNDDFGVTVDNQEDQGISSFLRDGYRIFHTYRIGARGAELMLNTFSMLDLTAFGRQETWEDSPEGWPQTEPYQWWRRHHRYESDNG